eukprot:767668-Hanusia_phi.AAC.4
MRGDEGKLRGRGQCAAAGAGCPPLVTHTAAWLNHYSACLAVPRQAGQASKLAFGSGPRLFPEPYVYWH